MKNIIQITAILIFTTLTFSIYAQSFGIKGGLNISNLKFDWEDESSSETFDSRFGFHVGLTAEFGNTLKLAPEILLSTRGCVIDADPGGAFKMLYLDIPVYLKYTHDMGSAKIFAQAGPYLGVALSGTSEVNGADDEKMTFGNDEVEDFFKRTDYGLSFGAGLEFSKVVISINYNIGLSNMLPYDESTCKNRVLAASLGFKF